MKAIKLIIIFIVLLGGVVGAFFLLTDVEIDVLPSPSNTIYQSFSDEIKDDWKKKGDWDEKLFLRHCESISQLGTKSETGTLKDLNTTTGIEIVDRKIFDAWSSASCQKSTIEKYIQAIQVIEREDKNAETDVRVKKIRSVYATYCEAYRLAHQSIGLSPSFNGYSWNSYNNYAASVRGKRDHMLGNSIYKEHLSGILELKNGLNSIPDKLSAGKTHFYNALADRIISYYSRTRGQLDNLRNVKSKFDQEFHKVGKLDRFVDEYTDREFEEYG